MSRRYHRRRLLRLISGAGLATLFPSSLRAQSNGAAICRVFQLLGDAWREVPSGRAALGPGDRLASGDLVATGRSSKLQLLFVDGSTLTLGPDCQVGIAEFDPGPDAAVAIFRLIGGALKVTVGDAVQWNTFEVEGGTAVASVRATEWAMQEGDSGTAVLGLEGAVAVRAKPLPGESPTGEATMEVVLGPGEGTDVPPGGPPTTPKTWGAGRRDELLALVTLP